MFSKKNIFVYILVTMINLVLFTVISLSLVQYYTGEVLGLAKISKAMYLIKNNYTKKLPNGTLSEAALRGMISGFGDKYAAYIEPANLEKFYQSLRGEFIGIGVFVGKKDDNIIVVAPLEKSPADMAGIKSGDIILKVDDKHSKDLSLEEVATAIRGPKDTVVTLTLLRNNEELVFEVTRAVIPQKSAHSKILADNIGYLRISYFDDSAGNLFPTELKKLTDANISKIILDLRSNPGGNVEDAVKIARLIVPEGPIVTLVNNKQQSYTYKSTLSSAVPFKMIVLIDRGTGSAAELLAGALQDTKVGTLLGETTYGKGSFQTVKNFWPDSALKFTTGKYLIPSGQSIDGVGIKPDILVPWNGKDDNQLAKALEILRDSN